MIDRGTERSRLHEKEDQKMLAIQEFRDSEPVIRGKNTSSSLNSELNAARTELGVRCSKRSSRQIALFYY